MLKNVRALIVALTCILSAAVPVTTVAQDRTCREIRARTVELAEAQDLRGLQAEFDREQIDITCSGEFRTWLGTTVATLMGNEAYRRVQAGAAIADQEELLRESLNYRRQWRALFWLGDIAMERDEYEEAGQLYNEALSVIQDEVETPEAPAPEIIGLVFARVQEAQLLADDYIEPPRHRSAEGSVSVAVSFRGFVPRAVVVPVQFEFGLTVFTPKGRDAAANLLSDLQAEGEPGIVLIGHTDDRGSRAYNQDLSERRAAALRDWLIAEGYRGPIDIEARGEDEPFAVTDASRYTAEEIHAMNRRVELRRMP